MAEMVWGKSISACLGVWVSFVTLLSLRVYHVCYVFHCLGCHHTADIIWGVCLDVL